MLERYKDFEFLLDVEKGRKQYFFNAHVSRGCFRPSELEYFYHKRISEYLTLKLQQPTSESKLPKDILYICFDHKVQQDNYFVWYLSFIIDDQTFHELYKLSNIKLYYRILMPEELLEEEEPIPVQIIDH
jgi:hypothetical protein